MIPPFTVQTNVKLVALADGREARITGVLDDLTPVNTLSVRILDTAGRPLGEELVLAHQQYQTVVNINDIQAVALTGGGFEVLYSTTTTDLAGNATVTEHGDAIGANGLLLGENFTSVVSSPIPPAPGTSLAGPLLAELAGDRFAVAYQTFDPAGQPTAHVALENAVGGIYADVQVALPPDAITHHNGDVTLVWNDTGTVIREVIGGDGAVLMARGVSKTFALAVDGDVTINFDAAHDQLALLNADHSVAGGRASTLTFNALNQTLTWDPDSDGPAPTTTVAVLSGVDHLGVQNLQDIFRPEVLKNIHLDASSTTEWFDSDNSQTWDTLLADSTASGALKSYVVTYDDGTKTAFTFDVDNSQPYSRYVDQEDVTGHVLQRTTVVDNGESWTAKYTYVNGQVVSYEVDSFDVGGHLVAQGFFNADGSVMAH